MQPGLTFKVSLETSETLFAMMAALNACGYNQELAGSDPLRAQIRGEVAAAVQASQAVKDAEEQVCHFAVDHQQADAGHDVAQYISLALNLSDPPSFSLTTHESDLPPDAAYVFGMAPLLQTFYTTAGMHNIWQAHKGDYERMVETLHEPVANTILRTDLYLKLQFSGYAGRRFLIYVEPLIAPGQINARNYGDDYYLVVSPTHGGLQLEQVRHTYLHYVLDPYAMKHGTGLKRLEPILLAVRTAPMDESFKNDISLLVTESLIRAVEARTLHVSGKDAEEQKQRAADDSVKEGFVLTRYFFDALHKFEQDPAGIKDSYADWIYGIDVDHERKLADSVEFSRQALPEVLRASHPQTASVLDLAELRLGSHDAGGAQKLAQQALDEKNDDPARALFILARAAALSGDTAGARTYFERTLEVAREPRVVAWSHIYLGRIYDVQENRDGAVLQYRAALAAGDITPDTKLAAERGLAEPYTPSRKPLN